MKRALVAAFLGLALFATQARPQTPEDPNEGSQAEWDGANAALRFRWFGKSGRTYFAQQSQDLQSWQFLPVIEPGYDYVREWGYTTSTNRVFLRLRYTDVSSPNPWGDDFDGDHVGNGDEVSLGGTDPFSLADTDQDGMSDDWETFHALEKTNAADATEDSDYDGSNNLAEYQAGTNPRDWDSDGDLLPNEWEHQMGLNPLDATGANGADGDPDGDGLINFREWGFGGDPHSTDTDLDGTADGQEAVQGSYPNDASDNGQAPSEDEVLEMRIIVGDPSGSASERWMVQVRDLATGKLILNHGSREFGQLSAEADSVFKQFRKGRAYDISLAWAATDPEKLSEHPEFYPDYDWKLEVSYKDGAGSWVDVSNDQATRFVILDPYDPSTGQLAQDNVQILASGPWYSEPWDSRPDRTAQYRRQIATKRVQLIPVEVTFEPVGDNNNITDNKYPSGFDANGNVHEWAWMPGKGKRIFPDAKSEGDQVARDEIYVKVKGVPEGRKVYLKAFDVDDPTPSAKDPENILDSNDVDGEKGNDNRGVAPTFTSGNSPQIECIVGADGFVRVGSDFPKLKVGMQPGDNYRVAASLLKADHLSVLQVLDKAGSGYVPSGDKLPNAFNGAVSPMLTVWRKLHVEEDTMEQVATTGPEKNFDSGEIASISQNGTSFVLGFSDYLAGDLNRFADGNIFINGWKYHVVNSGYNSATVEDDTEAHLATLYTAGNAVGELFQLFDDDDKLLPESFTLPLPSTEQLITPRVREKYYPAYIDIDTDTVNTQKVVPFKLNAMAPFSGGKDVPDSPTFWAYRVIAAYQPSEWEDIDPDPPAEGGGEVPTLGHSCGGDALIFMEVFRDLNKALIQFPLAVARMKKTRDAIVAHELGHGPSTEWIWINKGLEGWFIDSLDHLEGGLMANSLADGEDAAFSPKSLKRFRSTDSWQK